MADVRLKLRAVREAGDVMLQLLDIDTPPVSFYCTTEEDGTPILEDDERYWNAWKRIRNAVGEYGQVEVTDWREEVEELSVQAAARRYFDAREFAHIYADYSADGTLVITTEFQIHDGWGTFISERAEELKPLDVGRRIASIELAVLAHELNSPAETLDYWMTTEQYTYSQAIWAKVRNVSRQTVNDRVQSARSKLNGSEAN